MFIPLTAEELQALPEDDPLIELGLMDPPPIDSIPDKLGGHTCFAGTRVAVDFLFNHLANNGTVASFLERHPSVKPEQVVAVVLVAGRDMVDPQYIERSPTMKAHAPKPPVAEHSIGR